MPPRPGLLGLRERRPGLGLHAYADAGAHGSFGTFQSHDPFGPYRTLQAALGCQPSVADHALEPAALGTVGAHDPACPLLAACRARLSRILGTVPKRGAASQGRLTGSYGPTTTPALITDRHGFAPIQ